MAFWPFGYGEDDDRGQPVPSRTDGDRMIDKASWAIFWFLVGGGFFYFLAEILGWN